MKKSFILIATVAIFLLAGNSYSQVLWNIDVQDHEAAKSWDYDQGMYINRSDANAAGFSGINYIPDAGFVFFIDNATIEDYHAIYNELIGKFGVEDINKDHIDPYISYSPKNISAKVHEESINNGASFVYREWNEESTKIRFFWNQYRFWIEAVKK